MTNESKAKPAEAAAEKKPDAKESDQTPETPANDASETTDAKAEEAVSEAKATTESDETNQAASGSDEPATGDDAGKAEDDKSAEAERIEALQAEVADLKDRLLRAAAEMENMRRRFERDMADARLYSVTSFAREVLSIGDNLGRALSAVPEDARKEAGNMATLLEGVEMTERELLRVLEKHKVKRLEPEGEKFDPNFHQAMFEVEHDEAAPGTVVQVVQAGYSIGERVLRPAMVGVAKKKKAEKAPEPAKAAEGDQKTETADEKSDS